MHQLQLKIGGRLMHSHILSVRVDLFPLFLQRLRWFRLIHAVDGICCALLLQ